MSKYQARLKMKRNREKGVLRRVRDNVGQIGGYLVATLWGSREDQTSETSTIEASETQISSGNQKTLPIFQVGNRDVAPANRRVRKSSSVTKHDKVDRL